MFLLPGFLAFFRLFPEVGPRRTRIEETNSGKQTIISGLQKLTSDLFDRYAQYLIPHFSSPSC